MEKEIKHTAKHIICLDISSSCTGIAVFDADGYGDYELDYDSLDKIKPKSEYKKEHPCNHSEKLVDFEYKLIELFGKYPISTNPIIAVEEFFRGRSFNTNKILGMYQGIANKLIWEFYNQPGPFLLLPSQIRSNLNVKQKSKKDVFKYITRRYDLPEYDFNRDNDITDAIALGEAVNNIMYRLNSTDLELSDWFRCIIRKRKKK